MRISLGGADSAVALGVTRGARSGLCPYRMDATKERKGEGIDL